MITEIISGLKQGYDALENEDFSKANEIFDNIIKKDKKNANAYVGKLLAENKIKKISELEGVNEPFNESENFKNAILYGEKDIIAALEHCVSASAKRKAFEAKKAAEAESQRKIEEEKLAKLREEENKKIETQKKLEKEQEQIAENIRNKIKKEKKKKSKIFIAISLIFAILISGSAFSISKGIKTNKKIESAKFFYNSEDFVQAYLIFKEIGADEEVAKMKADAEILSKKLVDKGEYEKLLVLCKTMETEVPHLDAYKMVIEGKYKDAVSLGLSKFVFPSRLKEIPSEAFCDCKELEEIIIPEGVTEIKAFAFEGCFSLKKVTLPQSLEVIEENAFHECLSLTEITIPKSVFFIGRMAFSKCSSLSKVSFIDKNGWQINNESYSFSNDKQTAEDLINNLTSNWVKN